MFDAILFLLSPFIYLINKIIPLSKGKVLFYGKRGIFHGNTKIFYNYLIESKWGHPLWIINSKNVYDSLIKKYSTKNLVFRKGIIGNIKYVYHYLTSSTIFIGGTSDCWHILRYTKTKRRKIINIGHGVLVPGTKKTGIEIRSSRKSIKKEIKRRRAVTYFTMCSEIEKYTRSAAYFVNLNNFVVTGVPRSDVVINNMDNKENIYLLLQNLIQSEVKFEKIILYAPTHRDAGRWNDSFQPSSFFPFNDFTIDQLKTFLIDNQAILLLRTHDNENKFGFRDQSQVESIVDNDRIFYFSHSILSEVNEILPAVDLLISDYSTIAVDFLLCNKPIIYVPYDVKDYHRGIVLDYDSWTPGEKVYDFTQFLKTAQEYLINPGKDSEERERIKRMFHQHLDGNSCERILKLIQN